MSLHPSCGLDNQPEWVLFNEFVLTTKPYIRTVTDVKAEWLLEYAFNYFDPASFPDGETKRALQRVLRKAMSKKGGEIEVSKKSKREKAESRSGSNTPAPAPANGERPAKRSKYTY